MSNVVQLPITGYAPTNADVAAALREFAKWIEQGDYGDVRTCVVLIEPVNGHMRHACCGQATDLARLIGLIEFGKAKIMADHHKET